LLFGVAALAYFKFFRRTPAEPNYLGRVPQKKHAVVIGSGIGGLCAAKVLSNHFKQVTLIDRDSIDLTAPIARQGVPQSKQLHGLLAKGCCTVDGLFPGMSEEWKVNGAVEVDMIKDFELKINGITLPQSERMKEGRTLYSIAMTRAFNEFHLRQRLLKDCPNVQLLTRTTVMGLLYDKDSHKVTGVKIKRKGDKTDVQKAVKEELQADFVVGSAGRKNRFKHWFQEIGILNQDEDFPKEECFPGLAYSTSIWLPPDGWFEKNKITPEELPCTIILPSPELYPFGLGAFRLEKGSYGILIFSYGKKYPPSTTAEIVKCFEPVLADYEKSEIIRKILDEWSQQGEWNAYHDGRNIFNHYEKMGDKWPNNFVALGDTVVTFNPSFGQGMTNAVMHAGALKDVLDAHIKDWPLHNFAGVSKKFQKAASAISFNFWAGVEPNDLQWPTTEGERTRFKDFFAYFQKHVWKVACNERDKLFQFNLVSNGLADPPSVFFHPSFLFPVLKSMAFEYLTATKKQVKHE